MHSSRSTEPSQRGSNCHTATLDPAQLRSCSSDALWSKRTAHPDSGFEPGTPFVHEITARSGPVSLDDIPRTRWTCAAPAGATVVYGSQLIHGVTPVTEGRVRRLITNLCGRPGRRGGWVDFRAASLACQRNAVRGFSWRRCTRPRLELSGEFGSHRGSATG